MSLNTQVGSFTEPGVAGNQSVISVGFQPSLVLFWWNRAGADGTASNAEIGFGVGVSSSSRRAIGFKSDNGGASSLNSVANQNTKCIYLANGGAGQADFVSHDADGFTINWSVVSGGGIVINYLALGGTDLANTALGTITAKTTTGTQAYTGVGFQPTALLLFAGKWSTDALDASTNGAFTFGFGTSATARGVVGERSKNLANPQVAKHRQSTSKIAVSLTDTGVFTEADLVSLDADGFTLDFTTAGGTADVIYYLALRGPSVKAGAINQATSTGNQATSGIGFQPKALLLLSGNNTSANNDVTNNDGQVSLGFATGAAARSCLWAGDLHNVSPTQAAKNLDRTKAIKLFSPGTPTLNAAADLASFDSDGFTLNWTTVDATGRQVLYLALGDADGAPPTPSGGIPVNSLRPRIFAPGIAR